MVRILPLFLFLVMVLPGCSPLGIATGIGASAGIAASQEGGLASAVDDARIQIEINDLWFRYDVDMFTKLDLTINQGRVLITGVVQNPEHRVEAVRLAWQPKGVEQVINEIQVAESEGVVGFAKDTWITTRIRTAIVFDRNINSVNYSIDTVRGTVYLMGFAQNREELNRVIEISRTVDGVAGVVSYVKFVGGEPDENAQNARNDYQSTYDDQMVYNGKPYNDPVVAHQRSPQLRENGAEAYPNNVEPIQSEPLPPPPPGEPVTIYQPFD